MLTWAICYLIINLIKIDASISEPGVLLLLSMLCDVGVVAILVCSFKTRGGG